MDKVIADACPSCQERLYLDEGSPDTQEERNRVFFCDGLGWCVTDNKREPMPLRGWREGDARGWMPLPEGSGEVVL